MAALQLVSHLEGDALNVALLVPAPPAGVARSVVRYTNITL